mmetsp:Transcript_28931/g.81483  ORF Transcript_28931/g.81483 Transcript_28931/m.81483 type:complete len:334 (+) Transcript_28931:1810-2811(+)
MQFAAEDSRERVRGAISTPSELPVSSISRRAAWRTSDRVLSGPRKPQASRTMVTHSSCPGKALSGSSPAGCSPHACVADKAPLIRSRPAPARSSCRVAAPSPPPLVEERADNCAPNFGSRGTQQLLPPPATRTTRTASQAPWSSFGAWPPSAGVAPVFPALRSRSDSSKSAAASSAISAPVVMARRSATARLSHASVPSRAAAPAQSAALRTFTLAFTAASGPKRTRRASDTWGPPRPAHSSAPRRPAASTLSAAGATRSRFMHSWSSCVELTGGRHGALPASRATRPSRWRKSLSCSVLPEDRMLVAAMAPSSPRMVWRAAWTSESARPLSS